MHIYTILAYLTWVIFGLKKKVNLTLFFYYKPYDVGTLSAITHVKR